MKTVYVVTYKGEIKFTTYDDAYADDFCCDNNEPMIREAMLELGYELDDEDENHWDEAYQYALCNGELYSYSEESFTSKDNRKKPFVLERGVPEVTTTIKEIMSFLIWYFVM